MSTEVWFRNPHDYIRELVEVGECNVAWDRGLLVKKGVDPLKHADLYFGQSFPWRVLLVGTQGTAEYRTGCTADKPIAVYPTWAYGESSTLLEEMLAEPIGEHVESCEDPDVRDDERPVLGQEHRVVITDIPNVLSGAGRSFMRYLAGLQEEYPKAIIHVHGLYSWRICFGMGFRAADIDPRTAAQKGNVHTPSGSLVKYERVVAKPQWAAAMGMKPADLEIPRNRCIYNIKSALWAGQYYMELYKFKTRDDKKSDKEVDYTSSDEDFEPEQARSPFAGDVKTQEGDKVICNTCTLQDKCKYFREGSVCTLPGAEPIQLSKMFGSRDVDTILQGMSVLIQTNTNRLERGIQNEDIEGELDPEVSKVMAQVFGQAEKLVKLQDPLRFSPKTAGVTVNVGSGSASVSSSNPRQAVAQVVQGFIAQGYAREEITEEMVKGALEGMVNPDARQKAISGEVISQKDQ